MSNNKFRYQPFVAVSGNLGGKVPIVDDVLSSNEQEIYPTTSLDENCIEFEIQTDWSFYVDLKQSFLVLKLKFVKGRGYDTYESNEKKEHKDESVVFTVTGTDDGEEEEVARVTYVNNIMQSIFSNVEVYIYQIFSNLQFRRLLKNFFHSIHIGLRDTSGEKVPFDSVGITQLVLMFKKVSDIHFY